MNQTSSRQRSAKERDYLRVPLRATTFSTFCLLPLLVFGVFKALLVQPQTAAYVMMSMATVYSSVRAPATIALTFKGEKKRRSRGKRVVLVQEERRKLCDQEVIQMSTTV